MMRASFIDYMVDSDVRNLSAVMGARYVAGLPSLFIDDGT